MHLFFLYVTAMRMNYGVQAPNCEDGSSDKSNNKVVSVMSRNLKEAGGKAPVNVRDEGKYLEFEKHFRPTCVLGHSYCYDSFHEKYQTLKFARTKECATCPICDDSLCQKVFKIKCDGSKSSKCFIITTNSSSIILKSVSFLKLLKNMFYDSIEIRKTIKH